MSRELVARIKPQKERTAAVGDVTGLVERAGVAIVNKWHALPNCPGDMYQREAEELARAALLAALDLSEADKHKLMTAALKAGAPTAGTAAAILHEVIAALKALAQGNEG